MFCLVQPTAQRYYAQSIIMSKLQSLTTEKLFSNCCFKMFFMCVINRPIVAALGGNVTTWPHFYPNFKTVFNCLSDELLSIFNHCLFTGTFPQSLPWSDHFSKKINQNPQFLVTTFSNYLMSSSDTSFQSPITFCNLPSGSTTFTVVVMRKWSVFFPPLAQMSEERSHTHSSPCWSASFYHHCAMHCTCCGNAKTPGLSGLVPLLI